MNSWNESLPCAGVGVSLRGGPLRQPPACDYAEAAVWDALGGGWQCLFGCYCQSGVSIEWHDFSGHEPRDWARSFHPDSVEICLNLSGHGRLACGGNTALLGSMTVGVYASAAGDLAAWRLPGEQHQFLTVEYSRGFLEHHLKGRELALLPAVRRVLHRQGGGERFSPVTRLSGAMQKLVRSLRTPPVAGLARGLWYQGKALELMSETFFATEARPAEFHPRRQQVARGRVEEVIRLLGRDLAQPPSLEELGRQVGCSPYHLSRTFSGEMGMTIPQYLRQIRMERAAELLKSGRFNVTEAAVEVGYSSLSHFSHAFCETMGCCPGLYPAGRVQPLRRVAADGPEAGASGRQLKATGR